MQVFAGIIKLGESNLLKAPHKLEYTDKHTKANWW
jgi:hypothetical protein